jgi:hypothetical protein
MPLEEVERRTMWMSVWHSDMFGRNDFLGEVMLPLIGQHLDDPTPKFYSLLDRVSIKVLLYTSSIELTNLKVVALQVLLE